jgi:hypothetical protein
MVDFYGMFLQKASKCARKVMNRNVHLEFVFLNGKHPAEKGSTASYALYLNDRRVRLLKNRENRGETAMQN